MGKVWYNVFVRRNFFSATVGENKMYIFGYYNCQITYFFSSDIQEELKQTTLLNVCPRKNFNPILNLNAGHLLNISQDYRVANFKKIFF